MNRADAVTNIMARLREQEEADLRLKEQSYVRERAKEAGETARLRDD